GIRVTHLSQFGFDFPADRRDACIGPRSHLRELVFGSGAFEFFAQLGAFADVQHIENRLLAEEHEASNTLLVFRSHLHFTDWLLRLQVRFGTLQELKFFFQFRRLHLLEIFFQALQTFFDLTEIADHEVEFDVLDIAQRIDGTDVWNGVVFEGANHVGERVHRAQVAEESTFLERFLADRSEIDVLDGGMGQLFWAVHGGKAVKTVVGNFGDADVGFARVVARAGSLGLGENPKQRCLAYLGQADDANFHKNACGGERSARGLLLLVIHRSPHSRLELRWPDPPGNSFVSRINDSREIAQVPRLTGGIQNLKSQRSPRTAAEDVSQLAAMLTDVRAVVAPS